MKGIENYIKILVTFSKDKMKGCCRNCGYVHEGIEAPENALYVNIHKHTMNCCVKIINKKKIKMTKLTKFTNVWSVVIL